MRRFHDVLDNRLLLWTQSPFRQPRGFEWCHHLEWGQIRLEDLKRLRVDEDWFTTLRVNRDIKVRELIV